MATNYILIGLLIVVIAGGAYLVGTGDQDQDLSQGNGISDSAVLSAKQECTNKDSDTTATTVDVFNMANKTHTENYDVTATLVSNEGHVITFTDTSSPSSQNLNCGEVYTLYVTSTDAASGDNSFVKEFSGAKDFEIKDGNVRFLANGPSLSLKLKMEQQATLQARLRNMKAEAFMFDTGDTSTADYETDGVTFTSTTDNATATALGSGDDFHFKYYLKAVQDDTNWNDRGVIILLDAGTSVYDNTKTEVFVNGVSVPEASSQLTKYEKDKWGDYEYAYIVDSSILSSDWFLEVKGRASAGVNPGSSDDIQVDLSSRGQFESTLSPDEFYVSAVNDDPALTIGRTIWDSTIDVS